LDLLAFVDFFTLTGVDFVFDLLNLRTPVDFVVEVLERLIVEA